MTEQQSYEFVKYARNLFAQCKWTDEQWEAFAEAFAYQPYDIAREAVKQHFQETRWNTPTTGAVVNHCKVIRFGTIEKRAPRMADRTADLVVAEFRWAWEKASTMYRPEEAVRVFASRDGARAVNELRKFGWDQDQIDVVIQEITNGQVRDSFRDSQARMRETWSSRVGPLSKIAAGILAASSARSGRTDRMYEGAGGARGTVSLGDSEPSGVREGGLGSEGAGAADVQAADGAAEAQAEGSGDPEHTEGGSDDIEW